MDDSSEEVIVALGDVADDDEDLIIAPPTRALSGGSGGASRPRGRQRTRPDSGSFFCWAIIDPSMPSGEALRRVEPHGSLAFMSANPDCLFGLGVVECKWRLGPSSEDALGTYNVLYPPRPATAAAPVGFLEYEVLHVYRFVELPQFQNTQRAHLVHTLKGLGSDLKVDDDIPKDFPHENWHLLESVLIMSLLVASGLVTGAVTVARRIALTRQARAAAGVIPGPWATPEPTPRWAPAPLAPPARSRLR